MEEVDKIMIQSLKEIGCDLDESVVSLKQFTAELVVEATVRCLRAIQPGLTLSPSLPPSMSARYKMGSDIAGACSDLGYTGEIGYQTFLYSTEADIRRVFMFLVEKLPKETDKTSTQPEVATSLRQRFSEALRQQLLVPWSPPPDPLQHRHSFVSVPLETGISLPGQKRDCTPQEWREFCVHRLPLLHKQVPRTSQLLPSIISHHALTCLSLSTDAPDPAPTASQAPIAVPYVHSWMQLTSSLLYAKEWIKKREKKLEKEETKEIEVTEEDKPVESEEEVLEKLRERMDQLHVDIKTASVKLSQVASERQRQDDMYQEKQRELGLREKTLQLLPDSAANLSKLQALVDEQARNLLRLGVKWEKHRAPLVEQYREARRKQSNKATESARQLETAREMRERLRELKEELGAKEVLQARLQQELDKNVNTITRSAYTRRILEIIGNIKKQKEEIDKIVEDTKQLQRDINIVSDRVDRSFTYADEIVFRDCKQDQASRRVYKLLSQLHTECRQVVSMIEETGTIVREIRDLEEQIEVERAKDTGSKLERITADLKQMRQETVSLRAQLARAGAPS